MSDPEILDHVTLSAAWGTLKEYRIAQSGADGVRQIVTREVYDHGSAAAVLLYDPGTRHIVLTRQFRLPVHLNGDPAWLIEAPAGLLDGDTPEDCARREAREETGYDPASLTFVCDAYMSPGSLTEKCACFIGTVRLGERVETGGGLAHEGEVIETVEMPLDTALARVASGEIVDAKTVLMLFWLTLNRAKFDPDSGASG